MQKLNHNEFKKLCQYLTICDIHSLRCVCKKFNLWINKYKITNHKCTTSKLNSELIKAGCITSVEHIYYDELLLDYVRAGHLYHCKQLLKRNRYCDTTVKKSFKVAVKCGHLHICKWLFSNYKIKLIYQPDKLMKWSAKTGNPQLCKWLYRQINNKYCLTIKVFDIMIAKGNLNLCKWFISTAGYCITKTNIINSLANGHLHICKWILTYDEDFKEQITSYNTFYSAAKNGHLEICKWIIEQNNNQFTYGNKILNEIMIKSGHLHICKWLLNFIKPKISLFDFNDIAKNGHLEVCKWVIQNNFCDINEQWAFELAFNEGKTQTCKWLFENYELIISDLWLKVHSCPEVPLLDFYQWLFSVSETFRHNCEHSTEYFIDAASAIKLHLDTIKWFWSKLRDKKIDTNKIKNCARAARLKNLDVYLWMKDTFSLEVVTVTFKFK